MAPRRKNRQLKRLWFIERLEDRRLLAAAPVDIGGLSSVSILPAAENLPSAQGPAQSAVPQASSTSIPFENADGLYQESPPVSQPEMEVSVAAGSLLDIGVDFPPASTVETGEFAEYEVQISNLGDAALTLGTPTVTGFFEVVDFPNSVAPLGTKVFKIRMQLFAPPGRHNGSISFTNNDSDESPYQFSLTGLRFPDSPPFFYNFSVDQPQVLGGKQVEDSDVVRLWYLESDPSEHAFQIILDGDSVGLSAATEDVDALSISDNLVQYYLSTESGGNVPGVGNFDASDILMYDKLLDSWSLFLDGSEHGLDGLNIDAFELLSADWYLISFDSPTTLTGAGGKIILADDSDVNALHGPSGLWTEFFDGSNVGLETEDEDVNAVSNVWGFEISTLGTATLPGLSAPGNSTSQPQSESQWSLSLDGSAYGITAGIDAYMEARKLSEGSLFDADYGDAPLPYPDVMHDVIGLDPPPRPYLGPTVDVEPQIAVGASPDANDDSSDDGIGFSSVPSGSSVPALPAGSEQSVEVAVTQASGKLDAWMDFNLDGDWDDAGEQIFNSLDLAVGTHSLQYDVPASAIAGASYARFRISSVGGLTPDGSELDIPDGEVEDYLVTIVKPLEVQLPSATANNVVAKQANGYLQVIDADNSTLLATQQLAFTTVLILHGSDFQTDQILVDFDSGGYFTLPVGIGVEGGTGVGDSLRVKGTGTSTAVYSLATSPAGLTQLSIGQAGDSVTIWYDDFEQLSVEAHASFAANDTLSVGTNTVSIDVAQPVDLSSLTLVAGGTLQSTGPIELESGESISGHGSIDTPNESAKPLTNDGTILGASAAQPLVLSGYVKGTGTLNHVQLTGTGSPGASPAIVNNGSVDYASGSTTIIEIGGTNPGAGGHDQLNHTGDVTLNGTLQVQWINSFVPQYGNMFDILTWQATRTGAFSNYAGEMISSSVAVIPSYQANQLTLVTTGPGDINLDGTVSFADFLVLQNNFGQSGTWTTGDLNMDTLVTFADFLILQNSFGSVYFSMP